jgi:dolichol kinase
MKRSFTFDIYYTYRHLLSLLPPTMVIDYDGLLRVTSFFVVIVAFQVAIARFSLEQEAKRRWQHAITGHALVQISYLLPIHLSIAALVFGAAGIAYVRHFKSDLYIQKFGPLLRSDELEDGRLPGAFYFLVGTALTATLFPMNTARYAVECLAWADPIAAWAGRSIPSPKFHKSASLAGCLACFVTAWIIGCIMMKDVDDGSRDDERAADMRRITLGALACCVAEALPFGNDNLLIPLITAAAVSISE